MCIRDSTDTGLSITIFGISFEICVVPPKPVTRQKRSYNGTAANDIPSIIKNMKDSNRGVNFFFDIILLSQIHQHYIK